jgi:hypothetical protein
LNTAIKKLRVALDDPSDNPVYIETIPRRGYRCLSPVQIESPDQRVTAIGSVAAPTSLAPPAPVAPARKKSTLWLSAAVGGALLIGGVAIQRQNKRAPFHYPREHKPTAGFCPPHTLHDRLICKHMKSISKGAALGESALLQR